MEFQYQKKKSGYIKVFLEKNKIQILEVKFKTYSKVKKYITCFANKSRKQKIKKQ